VAPSLLSTRGFCHCCGSPVENAGIRAEYKQVTVLFADVVRSMDLAGAVGAERLREIMADLAGRCAAVVRRYRALRGSLPTVVNMSIHHQNSAGNRR
jgi:adenylate cyclase